MSNTLLKRQMSWKNLLPSRRKKSIGSEPSDDECDNISIDSTTSAFPSFEAKHFSKWKSKWKEHKNKGKGDKNGDGDNVSIGSTTSAFVPSKFPPPKWTTKFYANKFLSKRGLSKTLHRGISENSISNDSRCEDLPPWPKSATLRHQKTIESFSPLKKASSLLSIAGEESSVIIHASPRLLKVLPKRKDIPVCWEPVIKRERLSKKKNILSEIWRSKSSIRKINGTILEHLDLYHFSICRLVCKDWMNIVDCYYPRRLDREWDRYLNNQEKILKASLSISSYDKEKNPFFN